MTGTEGCNAWESPLDTIACDCTGKPPQDVFARGGATGGRRVQVLRELLPEAMAVLVDRRDDEMTRRLLEAAGPGAAGPVVGVAGLMHLDGIERRCVESHLDSMYAQKYIG